MIDSRDIGGLQGAPVIGADNDRLGTVGQVFLDATTGMPNWVTVKTGLFGHKETFVPLANADWNGERIRVDIDRETLKEAPRIDAGEALSPHNEEALYRYYGLSDTDTDGGTARPGDYPDRTHDDRTGAPAAVGLADADRARNRDDSRRDDDTARPAAAGIADADRARRRDDRRDDDADLDSSDADGWRDPDRDADRPRNLSELHPNEPDLRHDAHEPADLRLSEQPLDDPASTGAQSGRHARLRRYDPATDPTPGTGEPTVDRSDPPRNL